MKRYQPDYYNEFTCIADRCTISCCREWKITVDDDTYRSWKNIQPPEKMPGRKCSMQGYTIKKEGSRIMKMTEDHDCPCLAENGLCHLVSTYGEKVLSETCMIFPREIHMFQDHEEGAMMPCCPAVLDIWNVKKKISFPEIMEERENPLFLIRKKIMGLLNDRTKTPEIALLESFYILNELDRNRNLSLEMAEGYFSEETLLQLEKAIEDVPLPVLDTSDECNELLQDLAVNYRKEGLYRKYLDPVLELAEKYSLGYAEEELEEDWNRFRGELEKYQDVIRSFLANEVYSDFMGPEDELKDCIIHMQWIGMEYAAIRQAVFFRWKKDGGKKLDYETLRDHIVVITRMTGYDEADVREYLENSFQELLWDWGYFALIIGK